MNVLVTLEHRFERTPDGAIWTSGLNSYQFWRRYLAVFDRVRVAARVQDVATAEGRRRADGESVSFVPLPNYLGPWQYLPKAAAIQRILRASIHPDDAVVMRVSSHLAGCLEPELTRTGHPYGLEVVNDPYDVFAPGSVDYRLRPLFRRWFTRQLRRQCGHAAAVAYVTERALQERYPCGGYSVGMSDVEISRETLVQFPTTFTTHYSSVELANDAAVSTHRLPPERRRCFRLITVASFAQPYKGVDVLLRAMAVCVHGGLDLSLTVVGDGKHRPDLESLAQTLHIRHLIDFAGQLPEGSAVRDQLDRSDLFVLPSRCEGLPRAMVEAMARSLPCIGSAVGGIPELLSPEDLVRAGDVDGLAQKIREVVNDPMRMSAMSARNLETAKQYRDDVLANRRRAFFEHVRQATLYWLDRRDSTAAASSCERVKAI